MRLTPITRSDGNSITIRESFFSFRAAHALAVWDSALNPKEPSSFNLNTVSVAGKIDLCLKAGVSVFVNQGKSYP